MLTKNPKDGLDFQKKRRHFDTYQVVVPNEALTWGNRVPCPEKEFNTQDSRSCHYLRRVDE